MSHLIRRSQKRRRVRASSDDSGPVDAEALETKKVTFRMCNVKWFKLLRDSDSYYSMDPVTRCHWYANKFEEPTAQSFLPLSRVVGRFVPLPFTGKSGTQNVAAFKVCPLPIKIWL
jgi:hypothetical protein